MSDAPAHAVRGQTPARPTPGRAQPQQAAEAPRAGQPQPSQIMSELKVSGHLMTLDDGLYCIVQMPAKGAEPGSGLPGVRLSLPPGPASRPDSISIAGYRPDGWLSAGGDAALVRVDQGPAQLLVTIYQSPAVREGGAPNIQVMRLLEGVFPPAAAPAQAKGVTEPPRAAPPRAAAVMEMVAHIQERGDVGSMLGDWLGERGSKRWIEGFGVSPTRLVAPKDIEYQGVLGQGWLSPWVEGGQFCGSRAMALPLLGLRVRLRPEAAEAYDVVYSATFIDGSEVGPVMNGEPCEADSLAAMEAFRVEIRPRARAQQPEPPARTKAAKPARAAEPQPEPAVRAAPSGRTKKTKEAEPARAKGSSGRAKR